MNQLNHQSLIEESCENKSSNLLTRPTSLDLTTSVPILDHVARSKEIENIKEALKDSPTLKQALLNIANSPDLNSLGSPGELNLSQILNSLINSPSIMNSTTLTTFGADGVSFPNEVNKNNNLLTNIVGNQLMIQPNKDQSALINSGLTYHTILNLCQQQQQNQLLKPLNLLDHNILTGNQSAAQSAQPQLILLAQSPNPNGLPNSNRTSNGQSFPISLVNNNQTTSLNLVKKEVIENTPIEIPNNDMNEDSSDTKKRNLKRDLSLNDSFGGMNMKSRRRKAASPSRLDMNQDSSGCLSPSGKTNCSASPKGADSTSSNNNYPTSADPFEKSRLMRLEKKRARNRDAAKKCRERKLTLIRSLEVHVAQLAEDNRSLKARLSKSRAEVERLKSFVVEHLDKDCEFMSNINTSSSSLQSNNDLPSSPTSA